MPTENPEEKLLATNVQVIDPGPASVLAPGHTYDSVTDKIAGTVFLKWKNTPKGWIIGALISFAIVNVLLYAVSVLFLKGVGIWGINIPIGWGFAIINFVWWIGIGHAGTLISAILFLLKQDWRTSINRFAEAMTLFAVACAAMFPILHLGRPWLFYWLMPYPSSMWLWPQPRSPLEWDVFAVSTYGTVSLVFWYVGLIPDLATMRDSAPKLWMQRMYGVLALGWRGSIKHWHRYNKAYLLLAGLSTPLVLSVHTIVSFDFAISVIPGWHTTIFPPYFVAGAIYSGFAMVLTLIIPLRSWYKMQDIITMRHIEASAKVMLGTGLIVAYGYTQEAFFAWYSGDPYESFMYWNRMTGPYGFTYLLLILCNIAIPQALWSGKVRRNVPLVWCISIVVNIGMWLERFVIVVVSLTRDFLPSQWGTYIPTGWDIATYVGTLGFFVMCMFLFVRLLPAISIFEEREVVHHGGHGHVEPAYEP
ncbi:MAG: polysulfide reductase NrfD [Acidobacteriaceae bacterium]|nr:polysulfide reductase NrfD [Acidobacteriaceae bacterium]MBV9781360.1 polysulfide reductase NrfD [Acidobacteriaceae bacterium]